jgi:hypothetical protein
MEKPNRTSADLLQNFCRTSAEGSWKLHLWWNFHSSFHQGSTTDDGSWVEAEGKLGGSWDLAILCSGSLVEAGT